MDTENEEIFVDDTSTKDSELSEEAKKMLEEEKANLDTDNLMKEIERETTYVRISEDNMTAWLYLAPAVGVTYDRKDLVDILRASEVTSGIHMSNLAAILKKKIFYREVVAALGEQPGEGNDGYFEYYVCMQDYSKSPKINEDGSVDYSSMSLLENVKQGQALAKYHPAVRGQAGFDVRGKILEATAVKDIPPLKGLGISAMDDQGIYYAELDGKVAFTDDKLEIRSVHEIPGDVDYITGMIDFNGDVVITGNVGTDVTIKAGKTVTIMGTVEAARIEAAGDVVLKRGIQGNEKAVIICGGSLFADFIEQTTVEAKNNIQANTILNSTINAGNTVTLTGKRGTLLGGTTHGLFGVHATNIGNEKEIKTVVQAGATTAMYNHKAALQKTINELKEQLDTETKELEVFNKQRNLTGTSPLQELKLKQINERMTELKEKLDANEKEFNEIVELMSKCRTSEVIADGNIYRGVILHINNDALFIDKNTCYMRYTCMGGEIEGTVISKV